MLQSRCFMAAYIQRVRQITVLLHTAGHEITDVPQQQQNHAHMKNFINQSNFISITHSYRSAWLRAPRGGFIKPIRGQIKCKHNSVKLEVRVKRRKLKWIKLDRMQQIWNDSRAFSEPSIRVWAGSFPSGWSRFHCVSVIINLTRFETCCRYIIHKAYNVLLLKNTHIVFIVSLYRMNCMSELH